MYIIIYYYYGLIFGLYIFPATSEMLSLPTGRTKLPDWSVSGSGGGVWSARNHYLPIFTQEVWHRTNWTVWDQHTIGYPHDLCCSCVRTLS